MHVDSGFGARHWAAVVKLQPGDRDFPELVSVCWFDTRQEAVDWISDGLQTGCAWAHLGAPHISPLALFPRAFVNDPAELRREVAALARQAVPVRDHVPQSVRDRRARASARP